jgi:hypothetical protein
VTAELKMADCKGERAHPIGQLRAGPLMKFAERHLGFCLALVCGLAVVQLRADIVSSLLSRHFDVGIDRSNMIWETKQEQASIFSGIRAMRVNWFRDAFTYPPDRTADFVDVVRQAKQANLKMLVVVMQSPTDYDGAAAIADNAGPAFQNLCGWQQGSLKLSQINLTKFASRLNGLLESLKAADLIVDAFEIGNEVDWACFNGDVPFGRNSTPNDVLNAARGYARFLQAAARVIRDTRYFPTAKIITFGMAHIDDLWDAPLRHHLPNPASFVALLHNLDGIDYLRNESYQIDGYGSHIYTDVNDIKRSVSKVLAVDAEALGSDLPIWITEFGWRADQFPNQAGESRGQGIEGFFNALADDHRDTFGPVFYYSYNGSTTGLADSRGELLPEAQVLAKQCGKCPPLPNP